MTLDDLLPGAAAAQSLHPVLVHLPLGLWPTSLLFLALGALRANDRFFEVGRWLLYLAALAAVITTASGWIAADGLGHDSPAHGAVHEHRIWMLVAVGLTLASATLAFALRRSRRLVHQWVVVIAVALTLVVASLGADRGAYLVYGQGIGTQPQGLVPTDGHADGEHDQGR
jgi:uncharacterized membrane protein